jgi:hypothetical protein
MRKGLKTLIAGIMLFLVGGVLAPLAIILPIILNDSDGQQFLIPGSTEVTITEPGRYYLWNDFQTVYDGKSFDRSERIPDGLEIVVKDEAGNSLLFKRDTSISSNVGSSSKKSIGYVEVDKPGKLTVSVSGSSDQRVFSFSQFDFLRLLGFVFGGIALAVIMSLAGIGITIWGIVKLVKNKKGEQDARDDAPPRAAEL